MAQITKVRGTADSLPEQSRKFEYIEGVFRSLAAEYGFGELRLPTFEKTPLYQRSAGETSDVVSKEMYSFADNGGEQLTLRPEGTAGAVRAVIENGLLADALPRKLFYTISCFRYNRPQAGRLREFHQFGAEVFGADSWLADAELLCLVTRALEKLGLKNDVTLRLNSIGCTTCRGEYRKALLEYFGGHKQELCETCLSRMEKNPLRILDCKSEICAALAKDAPKITDYLCDDCRAHLDGLLAVLDAQGVGYEIDPMIVRGLDYYNGPVFEFVTDKLGAQSAVGGGGRYDGLVAELGGNPTPALGFAMGIERLCMLMDANGFEFPAPRRCRLFIIPMGDAAKTVAARLAGAAAQADIPVQTELVLRSVKASMRYANKLDADYAAVIGDDEVASGCFTIKDMKGGENLTLNGADELIKALKL